MTSTLHRGQEVRPGKQERKGLSHSLGLSCRHWPGRKRNEEDTRAGKPAGGTDHGPLTKEISNPTLLTLSTQKGAQATGRQDRRHRQRRKRDRTQGTWPVLTSELNTETMQRKIRESARGKGERRESVRVPCMHRARGSQSRHPSLPTVALQGRV